MFVSLLKILLMVFVALSFLNQLETKSHHTDDDLELIFRERTHSDWRDVWHQETHSRCRDKLLRHLFWACEKDIYRLTRRNNKRTYHANTIRDNYNKNNSNESLFKHFKAHVWFLKDNNLPRLVRTRRSSTLSITNECCTKNGCTWEEYAEYCSSNKRRIHY